MILIISEPDDYHAAAVRTALGRRGADVAWESSAGFPARSRETVRFDAPEPDVVWFRRPGQTELPGSLHPADRRFAASQCRRFRQGRYLTLAPTARWINPPAASETAESKILQHRIALDVGLEMPGTLYSNDPVEIRRFVAQGNVVYKPFLAVPWKNGDEIWATYTTPVDELVSDELLQAAPGIYQVAVERAFELRVTVMGARVLAAKLRSPRFDWRHAYDEMIVEPYELPPAVSEKCLELMRRLGIIFGCFDFIVTPDGRHVFLEVNPMGQWLWVEQMCGMPLLEAFCEFLGAEGVPEIEVRDEALALVGPRREVPEPENV